MLLYPVPQRSKIDQVRHRYAIGATMSLPVDICDDIYDYFSMVKEISLCYTEADFSGLVLLSGTSSSFHRYSDHTLAVHMYLYHQCRPFKYNYLAAMTLSAPH